MSTTLCRLLSVSSISYFLRSDLSALKSSFAFLCTMDLHKACRNTVYAVPSGEKIKRFEVPDKKVPWSVPWPSYDPPAFTVKGLSKQPWADLEVGATNFNPKWNEIDDGVNRLSHMGPYEVKDGYPLNPQGRTGLKGRGRLGRWGPNHAVDAIVSRWKMDPSGHIVVSPMTTLPIMQFIAIQRRDTGDWALPGGMVDRGESARTAVTREFFEEALNIPKVSEYLSTETGKKIKNFFDQGSEVYKGYVDDPRNTDNSWMETVAFDFHDDKGCSVALLKIEAGDDAAKAQWVDASGELQLYASHSKILKLVVSRLQAHW